MFPQIFGKVLAPRKSSETELIWPSNVRWTMTRALSRFSTGMGMSAKPWGSHKVFLCWTWCCSRQPALISQKSKLVAPGRSSKKPISALKQEVHHRCFLRPEMPHLPGRRHCLVSCRAHHDFVDFYWDQRELAASLVDPCDLFVVEKFQQLKFQVVVEVVHVKVVEVEKVDQVELEWRCGGLMMVP